MVPLAQLASKVTPPWVQLVIALIQLGREYLKYQKEEQEKSKAERIESVRELRDAFKTARTEKNSNDLEKSFAGLKLPAKPSDPSKLPDQEVGTGSGVGT